MLRKIGKLYEAFCERIPTKNAHIKKYSIFCKNSLLNCCRSLMRGAFNGLCMFDTYIVWYVIVEECARRGGGDRFSKFGEEIDRGDSLLSLMKAYKLCIHWNIFPSAARLALQMIIKPFEKLHSHSSSRLLFQMVGRLVYARHRHCGVIHLPLHRDFTIHRLQSY